MSVFVSLYVGTDYHDGTLRNKLISGLSRNSIYLSNLCISYLIGILSVLFAYLVGAAAGNSLFGMFEMPAKQMILTGIVGILLNLAYISIFNMISMLSSSKTLSQPEWIDQALIQDRYT